MESESGIEGRDQKYSFIEMEPKKNRPDRNRLSDFLWLIVGLAGVGGCNYLVNHIEDGTPYHIRYERR